MDVQGRVQIHVGSDRDEGELNDAQEEDRCSGVGLVLIAAIAIGVALAIPSCSIAENRDSSGNDTLSSIASVANDADSARGEADDASGGLSGAEVGSITNHGSETENADSNASNGSHASAGTDNSGSGGSQSAKQ